MVFNYDLRRRRATSCDLSPSDDVVSTKRQLTAGKSRLHNFAVNTWDHVSYRES